MRFGRASATSASLVVALLVAACTTAQKATSEAVAEVPKLRVEVLAELPHDTSAFTQGFEVADGTLYEGTGLVGHSQLRELDVRSGAVRRSVALPPEVFGEGVTVVGARIWQLTWKDGFAIEWDRATLTEIRRVGYPGEGWGLCHDKAAGRLVMSDGTARLRFLDPTSFVETGSVSVRTAGQPLAGLNELECVDGVVWANLYPTDTMVRIDPASGAVTAAVDAAGLLPASRRSGADVLNGIAALPTPGEFLITGKLWPATFRVRFVPVTN